MAELASAHRELEHLLRARRVGGRAGGLRRFPLLDRLLDLLLDLVQLDGEVLQHGGATPSPSRMRPSRMCSVPTYSWWSRAASSRAIARTFRTRSVKL